MNNLSKMLGCVKIKMNIKILFKTDNIALYRNQLKKKNENVIKHDFFERETTKMKPDGLRRKIMCKEKKGSKLRL